MKRKISPKRLIGGVLFTVAFVIFAYVVDAVSVVDEVAHGGVGCVWGLVGAVVFVVDADDGAGKGEHLAEGGEYGGVYDAGGWYDESGGEQQ